MAQAQTVAEYYSLKVDRLSAYRGIPMICAEGLHETVAEAAVELLRPGQSVLDVGTGRGAFALRMADLGFQVDACDTNDLCMCRDAVNFLPVTAEDLGASEAYDGIFMIELLEHVESPFGLIRKYSEQLRPGGHLFITTPNVDADFSRAWFLITGRHWYFEQRHLDNDGHITPLHDFQLQHVFDELGLETVRRFDTVSEPRIDAGLFRGLNFAYRWYRRLKRQSPITGLVSVYVVRKPA